jgi:hypothetical protein
MSVKVYCVFKEENECPIGPDGDEGFIEWEVLEKIFDSEKKAESWILAQNVLAQHFLKIKVFDVE